MKEGLWKKVKQIVLGVPSDTRLTPIVPGHPKERWTGKSKELIRFKYIFYFKKDALRRFLPDHLIDQNDVNDIEEDHFTAKVQHCDTEETVMLTIYAPVIFACLRKAAGISHRDFLSVSQQRF